MESLTSCYQESHFVPISRITSVRDYEMTSVYEAQQDRLFHYRYTQNQLRVNNLTYVNPSFVGELRYPPKAITTAPPPPRYTGYVYDNYNGQGHILQNGESVYDKPRMNDYANVYPEWNNRNTCYDNESVYSTGVKSTRNSTLSRSKSKDKCRKKLAYDEVSLSWDNSLQQIGLPNDGRLDGYLVPRNRNLSGGIPMQQRTQYPMHDEIYEQYHNDPKVSVRSDSSHGRWQQWPWSSKETYCSPAVLSPSSPLDSGLSSQSIASSPSIEAEPLHVRRTPECGSPVSLANRDENQCSCSTNSVVEPHHLLSPQLRVDSGRSSPWTQSALTRLNTLTRSKKKRTTVPCEAPSYVNTIHTVPRDYDQRRYSMSGIITDHPRNYDQTHTKISEFQNENLKSLRKQPLRSPTSPTTVYEYIDDIVIPQVSSPLPLAESRYYQRPEHFSQLEVDTGTMDRRINKCNKASPNQEDFDKSPEPESSISLPASQSPTDLSSPTSTKSESESQKHKKQSNKNSEKAICELEEIYNKLNLDDYDLLDRAERRDLPTAHQMPRFRNAVKTPGLTRSKSDSFYEILGSAYCNPFKKPPRAPPARRSGVVDPVADDMALRKLQKPPTKSANANENTITYMLCSSHFTPTVPAPNDFLFPNRPDVEYDDLSYRRYFHMSSGKLDKPQPPFGIPIKPPAPQSLYSDYMHVMPSNVPQPLCHPRGNPDLVRDDMAFRTLRKDNPERAMYDSVSLYTRKKR